MKDGETLKKGDKLIQKDLSNTLKKIQKDPKSFYNGKIAQDIAENTGLDLNDINNYETRKKDAIYTNISDGKKELMIYGAPAPMGSQFSMEMIKLMFQKQVANPEDDLKSYMDGFYNSFMQAREDAIKYIADPEFYDFDQNYILSDEYLSKKQDEIYLAKEKECPSTTHLSIADDQGLIISATHTLSEFWGTGQKIDGFFMNNSNTNFAKRGVNTYSAHKRSKTSSSPLIVMDHGKMYAIGSPGGIYIPQIISSVVYPFEKYDLNPKRLVEGQRLLVNYDGAIVNDQKEDYEDNMAYEQDVYDTQRDIINSETKSIFGCVAIAGYSDDLGYFSYGDSHRQGYAISK